MTTQRILIWGQGRETDHTHRLAGHNDDKSRKIGVLFVTAEGLLSVFMTALY